MGIQYGHMIWAYGMGIQYGPLRKLNELSFPITLTNVQPKCR